MVAPAMEAGMKEELKRGTVTLKLVVIKDYECVRRRNFNTDTLND